MEKENYGSIFTDKSKEHSYGMVDFDVLKNAAYSDIMKEASYDFNKIRLEFLANQINSRKYKFIF